MYLKYNLCISLLSILMTYVKNILNWPDPVGQMMDMTQNCSLLQHKGNFPGISKSNKTTQLCLKYGLRCAGTSILERCLKNDRLSPKTMVQKNLSLATYKLHIVHLSTVSTVTLRVHLSTVSTITLRKLTGLGLTGFRGWGTDHYFDV